MNYKKNLPGETLYDRAFTEQSYPKTAEQPETEQTVSELPTPSATVYDIPRHDQAEPNLKRQLAVISLVLGIASVVVLFVIPLAGIVLSAVSGVLGIGFGVYSHKAYRGYSRAGIILSIIGLFLSLTALVLLCIAGWSVVSSLIWYLTTESGTEAIPFYNGFYY